MGIKEKVAGLGTKTLMVLAAFMVVVSAATLGYLSTVATASATVQNPFEIKFTDGGNITNSGLSLSLGHIVSGSTYNVKAELKNKANNDINAKTEINCKDGLAVSTCDLTIVHQNQLVINGEWTNVTRAGGIGSDPETINCQSGKFVVQPGFLFPKDHYSRSLVAITPNTNYASLHGESTAALNCDIQAFPS